MTEPEDVEEDLFADLYDADEPVQAAAPSAPAALSAPPPASQAQPQTAPVLPPQASSTEQLDAGSVNMAAYEQPSNYSEQNGMPQQGAMQGDASSSISAQQPEPQGTGIKEDG
ncbi:hypothetical protein CIRG_01042 [Coccidioides immitis RMSCC 2394]|uniref:Uncharacterized protein n=1 Tax=Coccidioides immitis RMSCC 2394 TaxID=404692 RepID=A0A0J7AUA5_COCIT|nr:hypothetical protein CIRG_01042 [Coccidioides immitis RMSCC 2394]